jgi:hypothetical protein
MSLSSAFCVGSRYAYRMPKSARQKLKVEIDRGLAAVYKSAYERLIGSTGARRKPLADFVVGFVEDRLQEEIAFLEKEFIQG